MNDPAARAKYATRISWALSQWDVSQMQGWIDTWSQQIAADVAADPRRWATVPAIPGGGRQTARDVVATRARVPPELRRLRAERDGRGHGR